MSGHMTMTSRSSRAGSSWRRPRTTSRSTSTCRWRPWQACTWREWSAAVGRVVVGGRSAVRSCWSAARSVPGRAGTGRCSSVAREVCAVRRSCSSRASRPNDRRRGWWGSWAVGSARRVGTSAGTACATRSHIPSDGCGSQRCTSRWAASASSTARVTGVSRVGPKTERRSGRSTRVGSARRASQAGARRSAGLGAPMRARTWRKSSACQAWSGPSCPVPLLVPSVSRPASQSRIMPGRCAA